MPVSILAHVVTYNSPDCLEACLVSLLLQELSEGTTLKIVVTDNASIQSPLPWIQERFGDRVVVCQNEHNLGFCGAHNQGAALCIEEEHDFLLILNPDLRLEPDALQLLALGSTAYERVGLVTPKLLRANAELKSSNPPIIDAAGMVLTSSLRHFDRGSEQVDTRQFESEEVIFGGTGACLLLTRRFIEAAVVEADEREQDVYRFYPQLAEDRESRVQLFDEAFFAYREDADLAWRARNLGWQCAYIPQAIGYHQRVVTPERRNNLPPELNFMSVRNRFLLQLNNFSFADGVAALFAGLLFRNFIVIFGVLFFERSSLPALSQVLQLSRRALKRRNKIFKQAKSNAKTIESWNSQVSTS